MAVPTRYSQGVSTHTPKDLFADYPLPDQIHTGSGIYDVCSFVQDFMDLPGTVLAATPSAGYTVTGTSSTFGLEQGNGGWAVLTPGGATTATVVYKTNTNFQFVAGQKAWFVARVVPGLFATTGTYSFGLQFAAATTDGIWFTKPVSSTNINLVSSVASTATTLATAVTTHVTGTLAAGATTVNTNTVTCTSTASLVVGQYVYGTGIPLNSYVKTITNATTFTISAPASATGTGLTIIYASAVDVGFYFNGTDLIVAVNDAIVARVSAPTIGALNTFGLTSQILSFFISQTPTATDLLHIDYVQHAAETVR
jgi:hypothetical protein